MDANVKVIQHNSYTEIEFGSSQANSLPLQLLEEIAQAVQQAGQNQENRAILLKSSGQKTFCSGADFDELTELRTIEQGARFFSGFAKVIRAMVQSPLFILLQVQGKAVGGGVGIIAAADYVVAHKSAEVALTEIKLGLGPYVIGPVVERRIGKAAFMELAISTEFRNAEWALARGLFQKIVPDANQLLKYSTDMLATWSSFDQQAITQFKTLAAIDTLDWEQLLAERAKISAELTLSKSVQGRIRTRLRMVK